MHSDITFITGAGSGIGRAVALLQASAGRPLALVDRDRANVEAVAAEAEERGAPLTLAIAADISQEAAVSDAYEQCRASLGIPTRVVANAGVEISRKAHETTLTEWASVIDVNLTGTFLTCRDAIRLLLDHGRPGAIVCVSSPSAFVGFAGGSNSAYGSSKGGISAMVKALAVDYAASGIRVNGVVPGATATSLLDVTTQAHEGTQAYDDIAHRARTQIPLGRLARPEEIAEAIDWLLGPKSSYVTGSHVHVDGGLTARGANDF
ncbi:MULTISPECIES: SDR family oxidoreductase [unclassified Streptomyces]|uniref:SDR family NAD(P)-dependent oxidoreductase n=1 Tax=unclassified Streptomyces TaxID=2593676 RepID=UPI002DD7B112|nr:MULTISPECIES: SDR family oxidoreductase [unclassified Streptomyces]WSA90152.1 SDR family oxidoreductase [Streptomyces sp. NBC_01795]WSB74382.1 SDR family oxidoreductase [Streptomyces sp. NBC_01775]WSS17238.1 SDR family oxidoreductase [Streptomyces sp. NBC_01186]WSS45981.1 SDR family oxidoreductase [Streptomyces sp. NBC_01187]